MNTRFFCAAVLLLFSSVVFGFDFELEDQAALQVMPLGTTVSDDTIIFYDSDDQIVTKRLQPNGTLGNAVVVAKDIRKYGRWPWHAVWHPAKKIFMLVWFDDGDIYAQPVNKVGQKIANPKLITHIEFGEGGNFIRVAWVVKKRFMLFYEKDGHIYGQVLNANGTKYKTEKLLTTDDTVDHCLNDSSTDKNGRAIAYYSRYDESAQTFTPAFMAVTWKFKVKFQNTFGTYENASGHNHLSVGGAFDMTSKNHGMTWKANDSVYYTTFTYKGSAVKGPTKVTTVQDTVFKMYNDPRNHWFVLLYWDWLGDNPEHLDQANVYIMIFQPNGYLVTKEHYVGRVSDDPFNLWGGCNRQGKNLICWLQEYNVYDDAIFCAWFYYFIVI